MKLSHLFLFGLLAVLALSPLSEAQRRSHERDARGVLRAFEATTRSVEPSIATLLHDERRVALATVVDADGLLLSKASELAEPLRCRLHDGLEVPARIVARDARFDVALVQAEVTGLTPVKWTDPAPKVGSLVVSAGPLGPLGVGLVGVAPKRIAGGRGRLGVMLARNSDVAEIESVQPDTPAERAQLQTGDLILAVDDEDVATGTEAIRALSRYSAGEEVVLKLSRGEDTLSVSVQLATWPAEEGRRRTTRMEGARSTQRDGFPSALQHDTVLRPSQCGGPLVDLRGRVVALNIARASRVSSYAVPAEALKSLVTRLKVEAAPVPEKD